MVLFTLTLVATVDMAGSLDAVRIRPAVKRRARVLRSAILGAREPAQQNGTAYSKCYKSVRHL